MNRRTFLKDALAVTASVGLYHASKAGAIAGSHQKQRRVIILGAGLAGLSAAYELDRAGYDVVILEARTRPGGRVYTMREPFSDGLYAEVGAARIQDSHAFTMNYVKQFNLTLDPFFPTNGANIAYVRGKRISVPAGTPPDITQMPLAFSEAERKTGFIGNLRKYLFSHLGEMGDPTLPDWSVQNAAKFEVPIMEFVRQQGASEAMVEMTGFGHDISGMSALHFLRDTALGIKTKVWYKIRGGNDLLPKAFAAKLADKIMYGAPVVRIEQAEQSASAVYLQAGAPQTISADYLICTLPLPVLRRIDISPVFSAQKRLAVAEINNMDFARVFLQSRKRFWLTKGETGWGTTDDPIDVWDYTRDQSGNRGILGAYTSGRMALKLTYLDSHDRAQFILERMERVHPGIRENFETAASHSWVSDPWSLGAAAEFKAGQLSAHYKHLRVPEGRIHFAGEHTSPWTGWMNGGLESGNRAAAEIQARG